MEKQNKLKQGSRKFYCVGQLSIRDESFSLDNDSQNNPNYVFSKVNFQVNSNTSTDWFGLIGGYMKDGSSKIYCHGLKERNGRMVGDWNNRIVLDWSKRFDVDELSLIDPNDFITIKVAKDDNGKLIEKRFLAEYDAIKYLNEVLKNEMVIKIQGDLEPKLATTKENGANYARLEPKIKRIELVEGEQADKKNWTYNCVLPLLITKESVEQSAKPNEDGFIECDAFVAGYLGKFNGIEYKETVAYPIKVKINANKIPLYDKVIKAYLRPQKNYVIELYTQCLFVTQGETVQLSYDELSEDMKLQIECGLMKKEEVLKKATAGGTLVHYLEFVRPHTTKNDSGSLVCKINKEAYIDDNITNVLSLVKSTNENTTMKTVEIKPLEQNVEDAILDKEFEEAFGDDDFFKDLAL